MHVFFEDDGQLKAGTVLADNDSSLQVEAASGKRLKIKAAAVLLRFAEPSPSTLIAEAQTQARELDPNFLWEVSGDDEFGFADLAREYFGACAGAGRGGRRRAGARRARRCTSTSGARAGTARRRRTR